MEKPRAENGPWFLSSASTASAGTPGHGLGGMRLSLVGEMSPLQAEAAAKGEPHLQWYASPKSAKISGGRRRATRCLGLARGLHWLVVDWLLLLHRVGCGGSRFTAGTVASSLVLGHMG